MSALQVFTSYTEVDAASRVTVAASAITVATLDDDESAHVYYDFGADYFSGDFACQFSISVSAQVGSEICYVWGMCNSVGNLGTLMAASTDALALYWTNGYLTLREQNAAVDTTSISNALSLNTTYYIRVCRDEAAGGTYGKLFCYVYTDPQHMDLHSKMTVTLTEGKDWRYLYAMSAQANGGGGAAFSGVISTLILEDDPHTLEKLWTSVRDIINEDTAYFWTNAQLTRMINDAERDIAQIALCLQHIDAISTSNGTRGVAVSCNHVIHLEHLFSATEGRGLRRIFPNQIGRLAENATYPQRWFQHGSNVYIEGIPTATYNLKSYVADYPTSEMSDGTDVPQISPDFRPLIILYAAAQALKKEGRFYQSNSLESIYRKELYHAIADRVDIPPDTYEMIQDD